MQPVMQKRLHNRFIVWQEVSQYVPSQGVLQLDDAYLLDVTLGEHVSPQSFFARRPQEGLLLDYESFARLSSLEYGQRPQVINLEVRKVNDKVFGINTKKWEQGTFGEHATRLAWLLASEFSTAIHNTSDAVFAKGRMHIFLFNDVSVLIFFCRDFQCWQVSFRYHYEYLLGSGDLVLSFSKQK